jgi:uncharacterized membrane protein YgcG
VSSIIFIDVFHFENCVKNKEQTLFVFAGVQQDGKPTGGELNSDWNVYYIPEQCSDDAFGTGTVVTLPLHCCYTVVTLLLHCCYTVVTLLLHCCYTVVTLLLHCCYTVVTLLSHCRHTVVTLLGALVVDDHSNHGPPGGGFGTGGLGGGPGGHGGKGGNGGNGGNGGTGFPPIFLG